MIKLLAKIFIKDYSNYSDSLVRRKYGILCGFAGVFFNVFLSVLKFIFGSLASSVAMIADSLNNLSDAASSLVQVLGFKLASKKPDREHPFGHGRIEYIAGLIISFFILYMGLELIKRSIKGIINPESVQFSIQSLVVMAFSIALKIYIYFYNHFLGKKINSVAMEATARDSLGDVLVTSVVFAGIICSRFTSLPLDAAGGLVVALFILKSGVETFKDTVSPLLGEGTTQAFFDELEKIALSHKPISEIHDVVVHEYGPGIRVVTLHAEVPGNVDIFELHDAIDAAEEDIAQKLGCQILIHMDPVDVDNERLTQIKKIVNEEVLNIDSGIKAHDIRIVRSDGVSKLYFELLKPPLLNISDNELKERLVNAVHARVPDLECIVKEINDAYL